MMCGLMVKAELVPMNSVWPSGSERATASAPIMVPAPGRLSISTGWPSSARDLGLSRGGLEAVGEGDLEGGGGIVGGGRCADGHGHGHGHDGHRRQRRPYFPGKGHFLVSSARAVCAEQFPDQR